MKNTFKKLITCMLIAAIAITGIVTGGTATVNAATDYPQLKSDAVITMKVGERKRFLMTDENGKDLVSDMTWKISNKNVISLDTDFTSNYKTEYVEFTANEAGTAIITGRRSEHAAVDQYNGFWREHCDGDVTITVKVTKAATKATAKQKKCKHSWKVTKKATCERTGMKTCKKCKLQKVIKKTDHKWETHTVCVLAAKDLVFEAYGNRYSYEDGTPTAVVRLSEFIPAEQLKHMRYKEVSNGEGVFHDEITGLPKGSEEALEAFYKKCNENLGTWFGVHLELSDEYITETETICAYCYETKSVTW